MVITQISKWKYYIYVSNASLNMFKDNNIGTKIAAANVALIVLRMFLAFSLSIPEIRDICV